MAPKHHILNGEYILYHIMGEVETTRISLVGSFGLDWDMCSSSEGCDWMDACPCYKLHNFLLRGYLAKGLSFLLALLSEGLRVFLSALLKDSILPSPVSENVEAEWTWAWKQCLLSSKSHIIPSIFLWCRTTCSPLRKYDGNLPGIRNHWTILKNGYEAMFGYMVKLF